MQHIPDPLFRFLSALDNLRCPDCGRFTAEAAELGQEGDFCTCPFDARHR